MKQCQTCDENLTNLRRKIDKPSIKKLVNLRRKLDEKVLCPTFCLGKKKIMLVKPSTKGLIDGSTTIYNLNVCVVGENIVKVIKKKNKDSNNTHIRGDLMYFIFSGR